MSCPFITESLGLSITAVDQRLEIAFQMYPAPLQAIVP